MVNVTFEQLDANFAQFLFALILKCTQKSANELTIGFRCVGMDFVTIQDSVSLLQKIS
jgi:hypothetical protein